jgi:hypothetical protein
MVGAERTHLDPESIVAKVSRLDRMPHSMTMMALRWFGAVAACDGRA